MSSVSDHLLASKQEVDEQIAELDEVGRANVVVGAQIIRSLVSRGEPFRLALALVVIELAKKEIENA